MPSQRDPFKPIRYSITITPAQAENLEGWGDGDLSTGVIKALEFADKKLYGGALVADWDPGEERKYYEARIAAMDAELDE